MKNLAFCIAALLLLASCRTPVEKADSVRVVRVATVLGRVMNPLSEAVNKVLPDHFPARIEVQKTATSDSYVQLIETGQIDMAMVQTDLAYVAYTQGVDDLPRPHHKLRGVAVLYTIPLHLMATKSSSIRRLTDLRGKRVLIGTPHSPLEYTVRMTLEGVGLSLAAMNAKSMSNEAAAAALRAGELDAVFIRGNDPSPSVQQIMNIPGVSFVPISGEEIEGIRSHHPFLHSTSIPARIYGDHPEIETVGGDMMLACRDDLPEELVYWITRTLFDSLPALADSLNSLRQIDLEHVQSSPIPFHAGAAKFYRERELFQ